MEPAKTISQPVRVWVATLAHTDLALRAWLDERELERLVSYRGEADRARFLLGAAMLRSAVGAQLGMSPRDVPVHRGCGVCGRWHGRPVVSDPRLTLSISHGGLLVALALAVDGSVGIDVERVDGRHQDEVRSWTRAEARFKAGSDPSLSFHELTAPLPGHLLTLATAPDATVHVLPPDKLLSLDGGDQPPASEGKPRNRHRAVGRRSAVPLDG